MKDADIITLDDRQHTTRQQMAHYLGMNYAWALISENGNDESDFYGLRGNAFLTKGEISNAVIFRNDDKKESMGMFGQIIVNERLIVIGSVHKLVGHRDEIKEFINSPLAIVHGDQGASIILR